MLRIKITIPENSLLIHITKIPISISHINYGNHLGHDSLVSILHEARMRFIKSKNLLDEAHVVENIGFVIVDLSVNYLAEAFYGEE